MEFIFKFFNFAKIILKTIENKAMNRYEELISLVQTFEKDFKKFYINHNRSAGVRLRKHMQTLRRFAKNIRFEVQYLNKQFQENSKQKEESLEISQ